MPLTRTRTSLDYDDYGSTSFMWPSATTPSFQELNRSIYQPPAGCSISYRLNMTVHDPTSLMDDDEANNYPLNCSTYATPTRRKAKSGSRISRALKELLGSRNSLAKKDLLSQSFTLFRERRGTSAHQERTSASTCISTPMRTYHRTPSADAAILLESRAEKRRRAAADSAIPYARAIPCSPSCATTSIRVQSFAVPEPRVVQFREPSRARKDHHTQRPLKICNEMITKDKQQQQFQPPQPPLRHAFVNSHEWTLSRTISELRLGVVGAAHSGKTSLIHRYLTGTFTAEESPEGGRFKKEVVIDGQSHLLLIRDEGLALPDVQFALWCDALIFVFGVENRESFENVGHLYNHLSKFRHLGDMPLLVVGTKDAVSDVTPRVISEEEGKQLANHFKRCSYYETSSKFGLNVERVFKDACARIIMRQRTTLGGPYISTMSRTTTPTTPSIGSREDKRDYQDSRYLYGTTSGKSAAYSARSSSYAPLHDVNNGSSRRSHINHREHSGYGSSRGAAEQQQQQRALSAAYQSMLPSSTSNFASRSSQLDYRDLSPSSSHKSLGSLTNGLHTRSSAALLDTPTSTEQFGPSEGLSAASASTSHLPTPSSTPTTQRKNRRISNIFQRPKDATEEKNKAIEALNHGVGRAIPIKQGHLYKKSAKSALNREWKKKYVCLYSDGKLTYHHNLKDYMDKSAHGKEVNLALATVRLAGRQRPRNTQRMATSTTTTASEDGLPANSMPSSITSSQQDRKSDAGEGTSGGGSDDAKESNNAPQTPHTISSGKKRRGGGHRRLGSSSKHADDDEECFEIVSCDQKRWEFCAASAEERDEWVSAIEEQIERALQNQMSQPSNRAHGNREEVQALRQLAGNGRCADCGAANPDWASLNLGTIICIECCGIHRNLGSHVSRVRSLELDDWPVECLAVMQAIGNESANKLWEHNAPVDKKPQPDSARELKEQWIRSKYEQKRFLPLLRVDETVSSQLVSAVLARDVAVASLLLARATADDVNSCVSARDRRTPLHLACSIGSLEMVQLLLWNNADMMALDEQGRSCLWHAQHQGFEEIVQVLLTAGMKSDYGMPPPQATSHHQMSIPEGAIMGSLSNRDYTCIGSDDAVVSRRTAGSTKSSSRRERERVRDNTAAFEYLPASII
ncbi:unnamed protein product [Auanema sp. JU1783]|nr:unnamed protein product [Auanema sp. JU1783]